MISLRHFILFIGVNDKQNQPRKLINHKLFGPFSDRVKEHKNYLESWSGEYGKVNLQHSSDTVRIGSRGSMEPINFQRRTLEPHFYCEKSIEIIFLVEILLSWFMRVVRLFAPKTLVFQQFLFIGKQAKLIRTISLK